jgi:transposase
MPQVLDQRILLPGLKLKEFHPGKGHLRFVCEKKSDAEVCPKCATLSQTIYDRRKVSVKDDPIRGQSVRLEILKRRFLCKNCKKPFTEPVTGILPGKRCTQRYMRAVAWAADTFKDLKSVTKAYRCSYGYLFKAFYTVLDLKTRERNAYPLPKTIGIDEHYFGKCPETGRARYVTLIVDFTNERIYDVIDGKANAAIRDAILAMPGRENVTQVAMDMAETYRNTVRELFPNASITADKFHVLRLLTASILKERRRITGSNANRRARSLLLASSTRLDYFDRAAIFNYLKQYPELEELYGAKEALHRLYRTRGYNKASKALDKLIEFLSHAKTKALKTLRRTLKRWRDEILNYFQTRITNARTEGFNNVAKTIKKRAYGFRSFENYRLRLLNACY